MYILSAKHHLVPLTKMLEPYDKTLKEMPKEQKEQWANETLRQMKSYGLNLDKDEFIFLAGSEYIIPLKPYIKNIQAPMEGKRLGERLKWLNDQISKLNEAFRKIKQFIYEHIGR
jgi:hypothetical protein